MMVPYLHIRLGTYFSHVIASIKIKVDKFLITSFTLGILSCAMCCVVNVHLWECNLNRNISKNPLPNFGVFKSFDREHLLGNMKLHKVD